ncbi:MAG TPA: potassium-transporting ATPase subunit KdpC [Pirellulales bacterium]|jgi:K+-transporting ATPase ATPase C chain|nr:potassium-transporting ATPase subunit KdpC [Pirellulales bacterium]HEV3022226.1 potassium-transporting ATPase subunit KdpC [Pirellulales bacterium]
MQTEFLIAVRMTIVTIVLTGLIYPMVVTGLARILFSDQANGSLVTNEAGEVVGSSLIGQPFSRPEYFWPRPSAAGAGYDATSSGGSNLGATSQKLHDRVKSEVERLREENPDAVGPVPGVLLTASASGLDPHITPEAAYWQTPRVAKSRGVAPDRVRQVVERLIEERELGFLGEARVNVLKLNLALDKQFGKPH